MDAKGSPDFPARGAGWGIAARALCISLSVVLASSCSTVSVVRPGPEGMHQGIERGDELRITTVDGRELQLKVSSVSRDAIVGLRKGPISEQREVTVPFAEVARLERVEFSAGKTLALGAGALLAAATAAVIYLIYVLTRVPAGAPSGHAPAAGPMAPSPAR